MAIIAVLAEARLHMPPCGSRMSAAANLQRSPLVIVPDLLA